MIELMFSHVRAYASWASEVWLNFATSSEPAGKHSAPSILHIAGSGHAIFSNHYILLKSTSQ